MLRIIVIIVAIVVGGFLLIQLIPYGHNHANPPVIQEPQWDSPQTRELAVRACFDCHSNESSWPIYSNIAPISWLVQHDVEDGRRSLNFSEWNKPQREARNAGREVQRGEMPDPKYLPLHPQARLTDAEKQALIQGLNNSLR
ncbi:MAG: heme-binding domain-containing protein [Anaerolineae bacterium]